MSFGNFGQSTQPTSNPFGASTQPSVFGGFGQNNAQQQQQQPQQQQTGGLFGQTQPAQQQPATSGGMFGSMMPGPSQQQPASTSIFGTAQNNQQTSQQPANTGLFGGTPQQQPPQSGGIFGNTLQAPQQQQNSGGLFGSNTAQQQNQPQQPALGSLLLNPAPSNNPNQPSSGGLFGNNSTVQQPNAGAFGNTTTTGLFGASTNQNPPTAQGTGIFGNTSNNTTSNNGGLFGNPNATVTNPSGGLFNQNQQLQQPTSLFSQTQQQPQPNTSLFGGSTAQPQSNQQFGGGLFGTSKPAGMSTFGQQTSTPTSFNAASNALGSSVLSQSSLGLGSSISQPAAGIAEQMMSIVNAWDPGSPACRFQYYFYNVVAPNEVGRYQRPPNATNEALWQKALRENPDPSRRIPALALGFDDLRKRADTQSSAAASQQQQLTALAARLEAISHKHSTSSSLRAQQAAVQHSLIIQRLTALVQVLHKLLPSLRSTSIRPEEESLRSLLEQIEDDLKRPGGMGRMKGKLNELWNTVSALKAVKERARQVGSGSDGPIEWAVVDEDGLNEISKILGDQQQGLAHLTKILSDDIRDIKVMTDADATNGSSGMRSSSSVTGNMSRSTFGTR